MGQVCSGSAGEEAAVSCPRSDAKRPGAAPKALGVCFSDFFGVGNLLGCRLHRGPEARTDRRGWTGTGELRAALGTVGSRTWAEFPLEFTLPSVIVIIQGDFSVSGGNLPGP